MRRSSQIETGEREWMDLSALTRYASVSERTLREWIHRPDNPLPAVRVGAKLLISRTKFDKWLESHSVVNSVDIAAMVDDVLNGIAEARYMSVKIRKKGKKFYVFVNYHGRRKAKCVGDSRAVAEQVKRVLEAKLALGDMGVFGAG